MRPATDLFTAPVMQVVEVLRPAEVRAVGGAVRSLLREEPMAHVEVDLATTATPDEVMGRLKEAGIAFGDDGVRWGCVAARVEEAVGGLIEVTTLREDKYVPGSRYPAVSWASDWAVDASRRDFTFNAISLTPEGELFDPYGGADDLLAGVVRFIGDPALRLQEDPLRLLRFFRFCGLYGLAGFTEELEPVFRTAVPALKSLSQAKIGRELAKLKLTPHAISVSRLMNDLGIAVHSQEN